jgi:hypothetical protein
MILKFVSDLWQVSGFFSGPTVSFTNKTDCQDITEILLKVALNTIKPNQPFTAASYKMRLVQTIKKSGHRQNTRYKN